MSKFPYCVDHLICRECDNYNHNHCDGCNILRAYLRGKLEAQLELIHNGKIDTTRVEGQGVRKTDEGFVW